MYANRLIVISVLILLSTSVFSAFSHVIVINEKTDKTKAVQEISRFTYNQKHFSVMMDALGKDAIDIIGKEFNEATSVLEKKNLLLMLRHFKKDAKKHVNDLKKYIDSNMGKELSKAEFSCLLISFDTLAQISDDRKYLFEFAADILYDQYWENKRLPIVTDGLQDESIVNMRIKKKASNVLAWIGGEDARLVLEDVANYEESLGNNKLSFALRSQSNLIKENGSLEAMELK